jgi:hypothetical protein
MHSLNQQLQKQFNKTFPFDCTVEQTQVQQNFPLQFDNHKGLFFHMTKKYSFAQLSDIIHIEISSDAYPLDYPKENVLSWGSPN